MTCIAGGVVRGGAGAVEDGLCRDEGLCRADRAGQVRCQTLSAADDDRCDQSNERGGASGPPTEEGRGCDIRQQRGEK